MIIVTFRDDVEGLSGVDTYDNGLRPFEEAEYAVLSNERSIDKIKITWQETNEDDIPVCYAYSYQYIGDFLLDEGQTDCD